MTTPRRTRPLLAAIGLAAATSAAWATDGGLSNGSFESFVTGPGGVVQITGWSSEGVSLVDPIIGGGSLGDHSAKFSSVGYLKQSFSVQAGQTYEAKFVIGASPTPVTFWGRIGADPSTIAGFGTMPLAGCSGYASWGITGTDSCMQLNSATSVTHQGIRWTAPTSGTAWLTFMTLADQQSQGGVIDGVLLNQVTAVPEPSTVAMMLAGLGLLAAVTRRRRPAART